MFLYFLRVDVSSQGGLYSAVLTAFLVESYQSLQPDTGNEIVFLLRHSLAQNYSVNAGFYNATLPYPTHAPFEAPLWALRVNGLWFASLVCSLATASIGMLVKQWLREFLAIEWISPRERLRARHYRAPGLATWKVFEIAAALPLLLHLSLALFFAGLCVFTAAIDERIGRSTIPLICAWAFLLITSLLSPLISPRCPYKIPLLKPLVQAGRRFLVSPVNALLGYRMPQEEDDIVKNAELEDDVDILLSTDTTMGRNDGLLTIMWNVLKSSNTSPHAIIRFILGIIAHRVGEPATQGASPSEQRSMDISVVQTLPKPLWTTFMNIVSWTVMNHHAAMGHLVLPGVSSQGVAADWADRAVRLLLFPSSHPSPPSIHALVANDAQLLSILGVIRQMSPVPSRAMGLVNMALQIRTGTAVDGVGLSTRLRYPVTGLSNISSSIWDALLSTITHAVQSHRSLQDDRVKDVIIFLLADSPHPPSTVSAPPITEDDEFFTRMLETIPRLCLEPQGAIDSLVRSLALRQLARGAPSLYTTLHRHIPWGNARSAMIHLTSSALERHYVPPRSPSADPSGPEREWVATAAMILLSRLEEPMSDGISLLGLHIFLEDSPLVLEFGFAACEAGRLLIEKIVYPSDDIIPTIESFQLSRRLAPLHRQHLDDPTRRSCIMNILSMYTTVLHRQIPGIIVDAQPLWTIIEQCLKPEHAPGVACILRDLWKLLAMCLESPQLIKSGTLPDVVRTMIQLCFHGYHGPLPTFSVRTIMKRLQFLWGDIEPTIFDMVASVQASTRLIDSGDNNLQQFLAESFVSASATTAADQATTGERSQSVSILKYSQTCAASVPAQLLTWIRIPSDFHVGPTELPRSLHGIDLLRSCRFALRVFHAVRTSRVHGKSDINDDVHNWSFLWCQLASAISLYQHQSLYGQPAMKELRCYWQSRTPTGAVDQVLQQDAALARECLAHMKALEEMESISIFPDELARAITPFVSPGSHNNPLPAFPLARTGSPG